MTTNRDEAMAKLQAFARDIMECWPDGDVDGGYLQDVAEKRGLILPTIAYGPCGENACACAEVADFPTKCYRRTPLLLDEITEPAAEEKSQRDTERLDYVERISGGVYRDKKRPEDYLTIREAIDVDIRDNPNGYSS